MKRIRCIIFLFLTTLTAFSQGLEIENVTKSELTQSRHAKDTSAAAAILYKKGTTYFRYTVKSGFVSYTEIAVKVKIYKKEGLKWANFEIPYYTGYKFLEDEFVEIKRAATYNLENDKIVKEKVDGDSKFKDKVNEYWTVKKITFPNVKVGSIIELHYVLKTENISELPVFQFQYEIPVDKVEYTTKIPEFYIYKGIKTGYEAIEKEDVIENGSQSFDNEYHKTVVMQYKQIKSVYKAKNIPALIPEKYVSNIKNYYGKLLHELEIIRMPDEKPKSIASTWNDVAKSIYAEKGFGPQLEKFNYFINDLKVVIKENDTLEKRMTKVYNLVKNKMNWNGDFGYFTKDGVEAAYAQRTGNVSEINLILVSMLRMSGLDANPVLLSTRDNGLALFPNKTFLNYVIAAVTINDKNYLLDATNKISSPNFLPIRALNQFGILIRKNGETEEVDLKPKTSSYTYTSIMAELNSEGEVMGKLRNQYAQYDAYLFKERNDGLSKESQIDNLQKQNQGLEVSDYSVQTNADFSAPFVENYTFKSTNDVEIIGDRIYFSPLLYMALDENPFKQENRKYPVDFIFPLEIKYNVNLKIPKGYTVEKLPDAKAMAMIDNLGTMKYTIAANENSIQMLFTFDIRTAVIEPKYYEVLKNFYKEMINKQTEKVVLKKG